MVKNLIDTRGRVIIVLFFLFFLLTVFLLPSYKPSVSAETRISDSSTTELESGFPEQETLLSADEKAWIETHPVLRVSGPKSFPPFSCFDEQEKSSGMSFDYLMLILGQFGLKAEVQKPLPWTEVLQKAENKEIDLLTCAARTQDREAYLRFSNPYLSFPLVIISRKDAPFISSVNDMDGMKVALVKQTLGYQWLSKDDHIDVVFDFAKSPLDALKSVSMGDSQFAVENLATASYLIEKYGLTNLKIAAPTAYDNYNLYFAIRKDWPELVSIINKGLASLSPDQHATIRNKWLSVRYEFGIRKTDIVKWVLMVAIPAFIILIVIIVWNRRLRLEIIQRKRLEKEREKLLYQLNHTQKLESIGRLAGGIAHEFNNMMGVIIGYTEMAMIQLEDGNPLNRKLANIKNAAERSASLTNQLLAYARRQTITPKVVDLNKNMENIIATLRQLIRKEIDIVWLKGKDLWSVKVDPSQIEQILVNLYTNSRDSISGTGKITIETRNITFDKASCAIDADYLPGDYVQISVSDNGCGMDKDTLDYVFEPFFTTKAIGQGTGLGLATVYGIVRQNNGFIKVDSEYGVGTTFKIFFLRHIKTD
ncbi:MAG: transporter substrate-binding domain-containing protein [Desulfamplus sp.]|nr:transporter substrate-binding domain-containing protein [Desulfamplus sp.]